MKLYHFTCSHCIGGVAAGGLSEGALVWQPSGSDQIRMDSGWQWLTQEPDPARQAWAERHMLECERGEWRVAVRVPFESLPRLVRWTTLRQSLPADPEWLVGFDRPGSEAWFLYRGAIPSAWILHIDRRP